MKDLTLVQSAYYTKCDWIEYTYFDKQKYDFIEYVFAKRKVVPIS